MLIVSIHRATRNNINENILFNILEYFSFLNFAPIKSPNKVQRVNEIKLLNVKIVLIKITLSMFWSLFKNIVNINEIITYALGLKRSSTTPSTKVQLISLY